MRAILHSRDLDQIEAALPAYLTAARQLADAVERVAHLHYEANEMGTVARNWAAQIDVAGALALQELRQMVGQIKTGAVPIPAPKPAPIAPVPPAAVAQEPAISYSPIKTGPRFRGAAMPSPKLDPVLAAASFRVLDRSEDAREITISVPRF